MAPVTRTRDAQRATSQSAILDAAVALYAVGGPDGTSLRDVAARAGLTHAMVTRYFGSKRGLVDAVGDRLSANMSAAVRTMESTDADAFATLLARARADRRTTRLLIRSALGDVHPDGFLKWFGELDPLPRGASQTVRLCRYGAWSLVLGWLTFDGFLTSSVGLGRLGDRRRDTAMAAAAASLYERGSRSQPLSDPRELRRDRRAPSPRAPRSARDVLLHSAIELFADRGPASVSIREVARHAGVNHGLVHRHFGTKDDLLAAAIEVGASSLMPAVVAPDGFDIDDIVHVVHHGSTAPKLIARTLVDDIDIGAVRRSYPLMSGLLAVAHELPAVSRPHGLDDPRLSAAAAGALVGGSAIWGTALRAAFDLDTGSTVADDDLVESAVADLSRHLIGLPIAA